jgi:hypothetical protein
MPERIPHCPTCKDEMEVGYTRSYGFIPVHWVTGEPGSVGAVSGGVEHSCRSSHIAARIAAISHRMRGRLRRDVEGGPAKKFPVMIAAVAAQNHG